jgi:hypothetical protein
VRNYDFLFRGGFLSQYVCRISQKMAARVRITSDKFRSKRCYVSARATSLVSSASANGAGRISVCVCAQFFAKFNAKVLRQSALTKWVFLLEEVIVFFCSVITLASCVLFTPFLVDIATLLCKHTSRAETFSLILHFKAETPFNLLMANDQRILILKLKHCSDYDVNSLLLW